MTPRLHLAVLLVTLASIAVLATQLAFEGVTAIGAFGLVSSTIGAGMAIARPRVYRDRS